MTRTLVQLPCTARELEAALHAWCDHHGAWDAVASVCEQPIDGSRGFATVQVLTLSCAPSETAASEQTPTTQGETK